MPAKRPPPKTGKKLKADSSRPLQTADLTFDQRGVPIDQLLLNPDTAEWTRKYMARVDMPEAKREDLSFEYRVHQLEDMIAAALAKAEKVFADKGYPPDDEGDSDDGPEIAQALAPLVPLVLAFAKDPPYWKAAPARAYDLLVDMLRDVSRDDGWTERMDHDFSEAMEKGLPEVLRLRAEREGLYRASIERDDLQGIVKGWEEKDEDQVIDMSDALEVLDELVEREEEEARALSEEEEEEDEEEDESDEEDASEED